MVSIFTKRYQVDRKSTEEIYQRLPGLHDLSYEERLQKTRLQSLEFRRLCSDLALMYKILFGYTHLSATKFFKFSHVSITRGHKYKLDIPKNRLDLCQNWFTSRRTTIWNNLPLETNFSSLVSFKYSIKHLNVTNYSYK